MGELWGRLGIDFDEPVRDPLWRNVMMPGDFIDIIGSPDFIKLSRILQLGPAHLAYPGASHTRRAHSIGVFEMAKRLLSAVASKSPPGGVLDGIDRGGALSYLAAALCHDLGHFPYAHSLKELPLREHESLTAEVVLGPLERPLSEAGAYPSLVAAIVDEGLPAPTGVEPSLLRFYRSMLSGVLDPDKLDYLNRDAWACGVPYGLQDVDFTLQQLALDDSGRLGVTERGVMAVEAILFSKYQMYRAVYWHKTVRAATAMIKRAVLEALARGAVAPETLYGLDDHGFYDLLSPRDASGLIAAVFSGALYRPCLELPYDPGNAAHARAADLRSRSDLEAGLARQSGAERVIIDLPEPISFETDLSVVGEGRRFEACSAAFGPEVVASFARSLRVLRVYAPDGDGARAVATAAAELLAAETPRERPAPGSGPKAASAYDGACGTR